VRVCNGPTCGPKSEKAFGGAQVLAEHFRFLLGTVGKEDGEADGRGFGEGRPYALQVQTCSCLGNCDYGPNVRVMVSPSRQKKPMVMRRQKDLAEAVTLSKDIIQQAIRVGGRKPPMTESEAILRCKEKGIKSLRDDDPQAALSHFNEGIAALTKWGEALLADAQQGEGQYDIDFPEILNRAYATLVGGRGIAHVMMGQMDESLKDINEAVGESESEREQHTELRAYTSSDLDPANVVLWRLKCEVHRARSEDEEALQTLRIAMTLPNVYLPRVKALEACEKELDPAMGGLLGAVKQMTRGKGERYELTELT